MEVPRNALASIVEIEVFTFAQIEKQVAQTKKLQCMHTSTNRGRIH